MNWLIIILIMVVIIGPVMYLVPNASDKRLTALRAAARKAGLTVQITTLPKLDPSSAQQVTAGGKKLDPRVACAAYRLPVAESLKDVGSVKLLKLPEQPTVQVNEVVPGWTLDRESDTAFWSVYNAAGAAAGELVSATRSLPDDVLAISVDPRYISCFWREKAAAETGVVDDIAQALSALRADLVARFVAPGSTRIGPQDQ